MKKVFINCPLVDPEDLYGDPNKIIVRLLNIADVIFKTKNIGYEYYDPTLAFEDNVKTMMECSHYIAIDDLWGLKGDYVRMDEVANLVFRGRPRESFYIVPVRFVFAEHDWMAIQDKNAFKEEVPHYNG